MISENELMKGRLAFQAADFPPAYRIRGDKHVTEFGTSRVLLGTNDPVDAAALCWAINNTAELIKELEEIRRGK